MKVPEIQTKLPIMTKSEANDKGFFSITRNINTQTEIDVIRGMERTLKKGRNACWIVMGARTVQGAVKRIARNHNGKTQDI